MNQTRLVLHALEEFQRTYPHPVIGRAHRVFIGRDEITVIEIRPRAPERRRFMIDVISRVALPTRHYYAVSEGGELERRSED